MSAGRKQSHLNPAIMLGHLIGHLVVPQPTTRHCAASRFGDGVGYLLLTRTLVAGSMIAGGHCTVKNGRDYAGVQQHFRNKSTLTTMQSFPDDTLKRKQLMTVLASVY